MQSAKAKKKKADGIESKMNQVIKPSKDQKLSEK